MKFIAENIYHVYNQGNNHQKIFLTEEDYIIFIKQMRSFLLPHADFIAYCLMPNHFHFLLYTDSRCDVLIRQGGIMIDPVTNGLRKLLSGYARIFNAHYNQSGSLFRQKTKSKCLSSVIDSSKNIAENNAYFNCFNYIHQNPLRAGLVAKPEEWKFSSYQDYAGLRNGNLCKQHLAEKFCWYSASDFKQVSCQLINDNQI